MNLASGVNRGIGVFQIVRTMGHQHPSRWWGLNGGDCGPREPLVESNSRIRDTSDSFGSPTNLSLVDDMNEFGFVKVNHNESLPNFVLPRMWRMKESTKSEVKKDLRKGFHPVLASKWTSLRQLKWNL